MRIITLIANPFQVNTYILSDDAGNAIIIDPACSTSDEQQYFIREIEKHQLKPQMILLTHGHIDHILGCGFMQEFYSIDVFAHPRTDHFLDQANDSAKLFGLQMSHNPRITKYLEHKQIAGTETMPLEVIHAPGHADGSLCFYSAENDVVFTGDVLFQQSIGRTDLPTGDMDTLLESIRTNLLVLPPQTVVYPGHGPQTNIQDEINYNPFLA
jgi:hydroxyacylglutathione hydrolase